MKGVGKHRDLAAEIRWVWSTGTAAMVPVDRTYGFLAYALLLWAFR